VATKTQNIIFKLYIMNCPTFGKVAPGVNSIEKEFIAAF